MGQNRCLLALHDLMTSGVTLQHPAAAPQAQVVLPWPWTAKPWRSSFRKSPQKLLGPALCYSGPQIPDISATWNSHLLLFGSVKGQCYLCRKSPQGRRPGQAPTPLLGFPSLQACGPALPWFSARKELLLCVFCPILQFPKEGKSSACYPFAVGSRSWVLFACKLRRPR